MTNGHGNCHGGFIFTLADSAFAFACNSYNQRTVAQMARSPTSPRRRATG
jgi:acyl-CoA thioesterase